MIFYGIKHNINTLSQKKKNTRNEIHRVPVQILVGLSPNGRSLLPSHIRIPVCFGLEKGSS
jgi:hypothetical protein